MIYSIILLFMYLNYYCMVYFIVKKKLVWYKMLDMGYYIVDV